MSAGESPFACVMTAIVPNRRDAHLADARELFGRVVEIKELNFGYSYRFENLDGVVEKLGRFIELERLCCPFLGFEVEVLPEGGPIWLRLTGRDGVKPFIQAELRELLGVSTETEGMEQE